MSQNQLRLLAPGLYVDGVDNTDLELLVQWLMRPGTAQRWVVSKQEKTGLVAVWPPTGETQTIKSLQPFFKKNNQPGVFFPENHFQDFVTRFHQADNPTAIAQIAGIIAPLLHNLHPTVEGIQYQLEPAQRVQRVLSFLTKFLPKRKAIAVQIELQPKHTLGLYIAFDDQHKIEKIIGHQKWPKAIRESKKLKDLSALGYPVEIGATLSYQGGEQLWSGDVNRQALSNILKSGALQLDPLPLSLKLGLKALRLL